MLKMDLIHCPEINGFVLSQPTKFFYHYAIEKLRAQFIEKNTINLLAPPGQEIPPGWKARCQVSRSAWFGRGLRDAGRSWVATHLEIPE
jgi:hypothetical protein